METPVECGLASQDPDYSLVKRLADAVVAQAGNLVRFRNDVPVLLRQAIDEVIDSARSKRFTIDEIEKTEKTYIGTKIEILLRNYLKLPKGRKLDLSIDGVEVDIKNTIGKNWTIPLEAVGHPCILLKADESTSRCSFGITVIRDHYLNKGRNRDGKRTISKTGFNQIYWLLLDSPYPPNFWQHLEPKIRAEITGPGGGTDRVAALFRRVQKKPISRLLVQGLAQQHDYMKRIRRNGGARDQLALEGIAILGGLTDRELIEQLDLPPCGSADFISFKPTKPQDIQLLKQAGHIE